MPYPLRRLLPLMSLSACFGAHAMGLGDIEVTSSLGEPLRARVPVRLDNGGSLSENCIRLVGPSLHHPELADAQLVLSNRGGRYFVLISTKRPVSDPLFDLTLRADGCGLAVQKDFAILLSPKGFDAARNGEVIVPPLLERPDRAPPAARTKRVRKPRAAAATAQRPAVRAATWDVLRLDYGDEAFALQVAEVVQQRQQEAERAAAQQPPRDRLVLKAPPADLPADAAAGAPGGPGQGAGGGVKTRSSHSWLAYLGLPLLLILLALLVALALKRWRQERTLAEEPVPEAPEEEFPEVPAASEPEPQAQAAATPEPPPAAEAARAPAPQPVPPPEPVREAPPAPPKLRTAAPAIDFPGRTPGIEVRAMDGGDFLPGQTTSVEHVMELAEVMLAFGRSGQAIDTLGQYIRDNPRQAVDPWFKLLDLYRQSDLRAEFDHLAADLHKHFNVAITTWDDYPERPSAEPPTLESLPHIMARLTETWGSQDGLAYLDKLLADNRGGQRIGFSMDIVRDILFLRNVLRQIDPSAIHLTG